MSRSDNEWNKIMEVGHECPNLPRRQNIILDTYYFDNEMKI